VRCEVRVPASSANLGPGFDVLAVALGRYLSARYELDETIGELRVVVRPELHGGRNLVAEALRYYASSTGRSLPGGTLTVDSDIPVARGLGSSAAAIVAGLVLANELCGEPLGRSELFRMACELEGHGDNVGAALFGGVVLAVVDEEGPQAVAVPVEFPARGGRFGTGCSRLHERCACRPAAAGAPGHCRADCSAHRAFGPGSGDWAAGPFADSDDRRAPSTLSRGLVPASRGGDRSRTGGWRLRRSAVRGGAIGTRVLFSGASVGGAKGVC
jgi:hypothetical protein